MELQARPEGSPAIRPAARDWDMEWTTFFTKGGGRWAPPHLAGLTSAVCVDAPVRDGLMVDRGLELNPGSRDVACYVSTLREWVAPSIVEGPGTRVPTRFVRLAASLFY